MSIGEEIRGGKEKFARSGGAWRDSDNGISGKKGIGHLFERDPSFFQGKRRRGRVIQFLQRGRRTRRIKGGLFRTWKNASRPTDEGLNKRKEREKKGGSFARHSSLGGDEPMR